MSEICYYYGEYEYGGIAIQAWCSDGPYCMCSVNLTDYGIFPADNEINIPSYNLEKKIVDKIIDDLAEEITGTVVFGPFRCEGIIIRLKKNYKDFCRKM